MNASTNTPATKWMSDFFKVSIESWRSCRRSRDTEETEAAAAKFRPRPEDAGENLLPPLFTLIYNLLRTRSGFNAGPRRRQKQNGKRYAPGQTAAAVGFAAIAAAQL